MPALQTIAALGVLLLPILVRDRDRGGPRAMKRTMKLSLALFLFGFRLLPGAALGIPIADFPLPLCRQIRLIRLVAAAVWWVCFLSPRACRSSWGERFRRSNNQTWYSGPLLEVGPSRLRSVFRLPSAWESGGLCGTRGLLSPNGCPHAFLPYAIRAPRGSDNTEMKVLLSAYCCEPGRG